MELETKKRNKSSDVILISLILIGIVLAIIIGKVIIDNLNKDDNYYNLTFDSNGGSEVNPMVAPEGLINLPTNIEKKGYRFVGWIINNELADNPYYVKEDSSFIANWHSDSTVYKINLHLDGGTGNDSMVSTTNVLAGLFEPTKESYLFNGWYTEDGKLLTFPCKLNDINDFYAKWIDENTDYVIVTFDTGESVASYKVQRNSMIVQPNSPYRLGYEFVEWRLDGKKYDFSTSITDNITLKAEWKEKVEKYYVVSFDVNGSDDYIISQMILEGEKALVPIAPEKEGYQFTGWELDGKKYDFDSVVNKDIELKAKWDKIDESAKKHIVSFNLNGGNGDIKTQSILDGGVVSVPEVVPTKDGYTFGGWYYNNELYDFNSVVTSEITLEAKWYSNENIYYSVIFNLNGGGSTYSEQVASGTKITKPSNPVRDGYTFSGWYYKNEKYDFNKVVTSNMTLTAHWEKEETTKEDSDNKENEVVSYNVTFDLNGGGTNYVVEVASGGKVQKPSDPTRSGYIFSGWYYNGSAYNFNTAVTKNITLVAQWTKNTVVTYRVTFNGNNGHSNSQSVASGNKVSRPTNPTKTGYTFLGWFTEQNVQYDFNKIVTGNMTLYAMWGPGNSSNYAYIGTPQVLNSTDYLADSKFGKNLLYKTKFNGTAEFYYSHKISSPLKGNTYFAIRIYNPSATSSVTIKINNCGAVVGTSVSEVWNQYYNNTCNIVGKTYTIGANEGSILLFQSGNSFIMGKKMNSNVVAMSDDFEGVINMTTSAEVHIATLVFRDLSDTYNAVYNG